MKVSYFFAIFWCILSLNISASISSLDKVRDKIAKSLEFSVNMSTNSVIYTAVHVLHWVQFTTIYKTKPEEDMLVYWSETENFKNLTSLYNAKMEITSFYNLMPKKDIPYTSPTLFDLPTKQNFLSFLNPQETSQLFTNLPSFRLHSWLIITSLNTSEWKKAIEGFGLDFNSDVFLGSILESPDTGSLKLHELYTIGHHGSAKIVEFCNVGVNGSLIGSKCLEHKYQRRKNLENFHLKVIGLTVSPFFLSITNRIDNKFAIQGGLLSEIFLTIMRGINASYTLQVLEGYQYGSFTNGSWSGMIGLVSRSEVDISASEISMVSDRLNYIEFTYSVMSVARKIYIRKVLTENAINWSFFANPFSRFLLLSVALCIVGLIGGLWVAIAIHQRTTEGNADIYEVTWIVLCAFCQKGAVLIPSNRSGKLIFAITYITSLVIFAAYSATLTSQLTVAPPIQLPFNDLNGLLDSKGWTGGPVKGDLTQVYMEKTCPEILSLIPAGTNIACELLVKLWKNIVAPKVKELPINFQEGVSKVLKERFAFIATSLGVRYEINAGLTREVACNVHELNGDHVSSNIAFGMRKNFPFKRLVNYKLLQLHQSGILQRSKNIWLPKLNQDCSANSDNFVQISISDIGLAPLLVVFCILGSFGLFLLETLCSACIHTRSDTIDGIE